MGMDGKQLRRQYFCICAGQQEELYLKRLSHLLQTDVRRVTFIPKKGQPGDIRKQKHIQYDKAVLFDHDGKPDEFCKALEFCGKVKCNHAYSNLNFDLWLLLHKKDFSKCVNSNKAYVKEVRDAYDLDNDADIKKRKVVEAIVEKITLSEVKDAVRRAERIRSQKLPEDAKDIFGVTCYDNPDLSIHEFIVKVFDECGEPP